MKKIQFILAFMVFGGLYFSSMSFSNSPEPFTFDAEQEEKTILFETNDMEEVARVKDLLSREDMQKLAAARGFIKIKISVRGKKQGTDIDIQGGN